VENVAYFYFESLFFFYPTLLLAKDEPYLRLLILLSIVTIILWFSAKLETSYGIAKKERRSVKIYFFDKIFIRN